MLVTLHKMEEVSYHLVGMNRFPVKADNKRFSIADSGCGQNFEIENLTSSFSRLRQRNVLIQIN